MNAKNRSFKKYLPEISDFTIGKLGVAMNKTNVIPISKYIVATTARDKRQMNRSVL